jgi:hypothetical protein
MELLPGMLQKLRMPIQPLEQLPHGSLQRRDGMRRRHLLPSDHLTHLIAHRAQTLQRGLELGNRGRSPLAAEGRQAYCPLAYTWRPGQKQGDMQEVLEELLLPLRAAFHNLLGESPFALARQHAVAPHIA